MKTDYDVIVIGGGPAGATAATLVAREGHEVLLLDRETFPRFRLGESLMPATYWTLERMGVLQKMRCSRFPKKYSVQFFSKRGTGAQPFYFDEVDAHESSQTWQVDRVEFDKMLLDHARESGVEVREGANVKDVLFEGSRATGVRAEIAGDRMDLSCRVVVDASGQSALIARKLGLREIDPKLRHASIYTRYRGGRRDEGRDAGATLIYWTRSNRTWFWFIPLPEDQVSVGVVGPIDYLIKSREGKSMEQIYHEELDDCPALKDRLGDAETTREIAVIRDFSYLSKQLAGDGWVMAGDAFGFLDPMYSTGVFFALKSAEFAADAITAGLAEGDVSARRLGAHGKQYVAGMEAMRRLVYAYYDKEFHFGKFLERYPECREPLVNLLVGNIFRRDVTKMFDALGTMTELPEARTIA